MNTIFRLPFCPHCNRTETAIQIANSNLPSDRHIKTIDIFSGHPTLNMLKYFYNNPDPRIWDVPMMVLDRPVAKRLPFGSIIKSKGKRVVIWPAGLPTDYQAQMIINIQRR